jgi:hypothetical protein
LACDSPFLCLFLGLAPQAGMKDAVGVTPRPSKMSNLQFRCCAPLARNTGREERGWMGWLFSQGGGLGGLALGYLLAAPSGRPKGEQGAPANTGSSCGGEAGGFGPAWLRSSFGYGMASVPLHQPGELAEGSRGSQRRGDSRQALDCFHHPGGLAEFCDPLRVDTEFSPSFRGYRCARPPATF